MQGRKSDAKDAQWIADSSKSFMFMVEAIIKGYSDPDYLGAPANPCV
jgi:hypothetical protein